MKKQTVEERRTEILEVTCAVVIERGFAATRISDVAKRLEVSSSLIHYHFDSKEQLLAEAFAHYARKDLADMENDVEASPTAISQLDSAIHNYVPEGSDDVEWMLWIDGWGEALRNPMMKKISQELDEQSAEVLRRVISAGVETGEFVCEDPHKTAVRLSALVDGLAIQFAAHEGMMDRTQLIEHVRTVAAAEVGIPMSAFDDVDPSTPGSRLVPPTTATDHALRALIAKACDATIRGDAEAWASTWTTDAVWQPKAGKPFVGRSTITDAWRTQMSGFEWVVPTPGVAVFEVDELEGTAHGRVIIHERYKRASGRSGSSLATSHDDYRKVNGQWLFAQRRIEIIEAT